MERCTVGTRFWLAIASTLNLPTDHLTEQLPGLPLELHQLQLLNGR
jgi:hypothetical protein